MTTHKLNGEVISFPHWDGFAISCPNVDSASSFYKILEGQLQLYLLHEGENSKSVYIGETGGRIRRPIEGRRYASRSMISPRSVLFFSHVPTKNKKLLRYLEGRIYYALRREKNLRFINTCIPLSSRQHLSEYDLKASEAYLAGIWKTLDILHLSDKRLIDKWVYRDHNFYEMRIKIDDTEHFADAELSQTELIVKKGSPAIMPNNPRQDDYYQARYTLIQQGILKDCGLGKLVFTQDHAFSAPYAAACVVNGSNTSPNRWVKRGTGKTLVTL